MKTTPGLSSLDAGGPFPLFVIASSWRRGVCCLLLGGLCGCGTVAPERQAAEFDASAVPDSAWTAPLNGKTEGRVTGWLGDFDSLQLKAVVLEAAQRNPDLQALAARLRAAKARAVLAGADRFPGVSGTVDARRAERFDTREVPQPQVTTPVAGASATPQTIQIKEFTDQFELGLNLSWEIDLWGRLRNRARAGYADFQAVEADFESARLSLAANTAKSWLNVTESERLVELAEKTVASFEETQKSVESTYNRGINEVTAVELALSRSNVASARSNLEARKRERDAAKRSLETLLGYYPRATIESSTELPKLKRSIPVGLPSELLVRRPDIRAVERRYAAAIERVAESRKALMPAVRLTGSTGTSSADFAKLFNRDLLLSTIAGSLSQAIFEGGRLRENVAISQAEQDELAHDYTSAALGAFREVETALAAEQYLEAQAEALRDASREAVFAEDRALSRFQSGLVTFITLLESQRRAFDSRSALIRVENQRLQNRIDLYLALGGDFDTTAPLLSTAANAIPPQ
ncbi:MAG: efflux transporter outer membrane subunit [Verrucomicrobiales bacterium]